MISEIKEIVYDFMKRTNYKIIAGKDDSTQHIQTNVEMSELIESLKSSTLTNQIKKYVAGALYLNKTEDKLHIQLIDG